ncbi:hypothetical protein FX985_06346 [Pseudomonas extremaustralis]|uniref:Uncharacterized protein n=1 Tax=Pseudomonas extremaustralis TaxID=359110 RepID=A0A5M9IUY0_9PSED|nr:hypothetical protein FX985_06346 [Pseudomonas extremaustralis]
MAEQQRNATVFDHVGQAFLGVFGVQRYIGATGLEDRQQADHHVEGALDTNPHQHVRADALLAQGVGQLIGARVELRIGQGGGAEHQRRGIRRALHLVFDQVVHGTFSRVRRGGLVPGLHQQVLLVGGQHRQLTDALLTIGHHGLQQTDPVARHTGDGGRVEQVVGVSQRGMQGAGLFIGIKGQVELGGAALPLHQGQFQARGSADRGDVGHHRLVVVHHLEQRRMAEAALDLQGFYQAFERQLLVVLGAQGMLLDGVQQLGHAGLPGQLGAQHLGVDEEADQPFDFAAIAVGDGHADA